MIITAFDGVYMLAGSDADLGESEDDVPDFPNEPTVSMLVVRDVVYVTTLGSDDEELVEFDSIVLPRKPISMMPSLRKSWQYLTKANVTVTKPLELRTVEFEPLQLVTEVSGRFGMLLCASALDAAERQLEGAAERHLLLLWEE